MTITAGLDFGGTATRFVLHDGKRVIAARTALTAELGAGVPQKRLARVEEVLRALAASRPLAGIGIGATGPVDRAAGIIRNPDTLACFSDVPLVAHLQSAFGVPVVIDNDAVAAAIGELRAGSGIGAARMLMVTLGTGIGVALLIAGQPFRGPQGEHPEAGHIPITESSGRCYCGAEGCWEHVASRQALQAMLEPLLGPTIAAQDLIATAAQSHEPAVKVAFARYGQLVGRGLATMHTMYMPDVTVIGGGAAPYLAAFRDGIETALQRSAGFAVASRIAAAQLGDQSGAIGAALMAHTTD